MFIDLCAEPKRVRADAILSRPLMDAGPILDQYADLWHSRHYPTGTNVDADTFGLSGGVMDVGIRTWAIEVDGPGFWTKRADEVAVTLDQTYVIRNTHDTSSATIRAIGTAFFGTVGLVEVVTTSPFPASCQRYVDTRPAEQIVFALIASILAAIIALMLIVARRRDRRLQRSSGGRQSTAGAPP